MKVKQEFILNEDDFNDLMIAKNWQIMLRDKVEKKIKKNILNFYRVFYGIIGFLIGYIIGLIMGKF